MRCEKGENVAWKIFLGRPMFTVKDDTVYTQQIFCATEADSLKHFNLRASQHEIHEQNMHRTVSTRFSGNLPYCLGGIIPL